MSDAPDPLEGELAALRPPPVSPELRRKIADRLARSRRAWRLAAVAGLIAVGLTAALAWRAGGRRDKAVPVPVVPAPAPAAVPESSEPTLIVYRRALARSPEELDAMLDEHATLAPNSNPEPVAAGAFARSGRQLRDLIGDD